MMTMICSKCGGKIPRSAKFCTCCGAKVERSEKKKTVSLSSMPSLMELIKRVREMPRKRKMTVIGCEVAIFVLLWLIVFPGKRGTVSTYEIKDTVSQWCDKTCNFVDSVDVDFRGSFPYEDDYKIEVYDVTVDVLGTGKGKILLSYIVGRNAYEVHDYYPNNLLDNLFTGGIRPDFETESFSDEDISSFVNMGGSIFKPDAH